jgi:4-amino-4-deoxy-L-arabinose transferase-like glycosyltransferase
MSEAAAGLDSSVARTRNLLWMIFLGAVAIRWSYDIALYLTMGQDGLMGADSHGYLLNAQTMAAQALHGKLRGWAWLGADLGVMPLYPWFVAANVALFGAATPLTTVLAQGLIDGGTCLIIYLIAASIDVRIAIAAGVAAAINPTQIVLSGLIYNDTLFVFFSTLFLVGAADWLRKPSWRATLIIGIAMGLAALDRILVVLWAPFFVVILLTTRAAVSRIQLRHIGQAVIAGAILCLCVAPILARNVAQYGAWSLTPQGGGHLAFWVAPLVRQAKDGTPWAQGSAENSTRAMRRFGQKSDNPFVNSAHYAEIGREQLEKLGVSAIAKAWAVGAAINLAAPAIIISPPIAQLPRTGFFAAPGRTISSRVANFMFHSGNTAYAWALLLGIAGVTVIRLMQLVGLFAVARDRGAWPIVTLLVMWIGFILATNGPIASPKYRLPIEPALCVLTGAGVFFLRTLRQKNNRQPSSGEIKR